ncbi:MAG: DUF4351 domain-containing protein [Caloramator sp.]|nr:DUF4351 domain-containing protein [Caloramator sp.]
MDYNKIEDAVMKNALNMFSQSAVKFFGIDKRIIAPANTEIKNIEINTNYTDYIFYTDDGSYIHFEFQTTNKKSDLRRFLFYDASLIYRENRKIETIVVYSSDIKEVKSELDMGSIKYSIKAFYMCSLDGDSIFENIKQKIEKGEELEDVDILKLTFIPLMNSKINKAQRAVNCIKTAAQIKNNENKIQCISMLFALLNKFGDDEIKKSIWEVFEMTEIGRMIFEDGIKKGREEGLKEGKIETILKLLVKKFGKVPEEYKEKLRNLSLEIIDIILIEIIDMKDIKELEKYLQ